MRRSNDGDSDSLLELNDKHTYKRNSDDTLELELADQESYAYQPEDDAPLLLGEDTYRGPQRRQRIVDRVLQYARRWTPATKTSSARPKRPRRRKAWCCCLSVTALSMIAFYIFCLLYFSPAKLPDPVVPDKTTNTTARLLTLNIFMRPPGVKNNRSDYKEQRLDYLLKYILPHYDVVTIQEAFAFANRRIDRLRVAALEMGFNHQVASPRHYPWQLAADGGLLLLSRFPILHADVLEYPRGLHSDWLAYKGALHALVALNATRSVHVYTSHTQASYDAGGALNQEDTQMRLEQFARLHAFVRDTARDDGSPILIMGDLNVDAMPSSSSSLNKNASSEAYEKMMAILQRGSSWHIDTLIDAAYRQFGHHPVTFADTAVTENGTVVPGETVLTHWDQLMTRQSIDRILWADRYSTDIRLTNVTVEKFLVKDNAELTEQERQAIPFTQISDHYGLSCVLELA